MTTKCAGSEMDESAIRISLAASPLNYIIAQKRVCFLNTTTTQNTRAATKTKAEKNCLRSDFCKVSHNNYINNNKTRAGHTHEDLIRWRARSAKGMEKSCSLSCQPNDAIRVRSRYFRAHAKTIIIHIRARRASRQVQTSQRNFSPARTRALITLVVL